MKVHTAVLVFLVLIFGGFSSAQAQQRTPLVVVEGVFEKWEDLEKVEKVAVEKAVELADKTPCIQELRSKQEEVKYVYQDDFAPTEEGKFKIHLELFHETCS